MKCKGCTCMCHINDMDRMQGEPSDCLFCDCEQITQQRMMGGGDA